MKILDFFNKFKFVRKLESEIISAGDTVVDLGCGKSSPLKHFSKKIKYSLGIDGHLPSIDESRKLAIHSQYAVSDILTACSGLADNSFDSAVALDVIEHLKKEDGEKLLKEMERIAKKKVIIYTPNGFLKQTALYDNEAQRHLSGWSAKEMKNLGFKVYGMSGFKPLRKEQGEIKYKPYAFWKALSFLSQFLAYYFPASAFQILCVKDLN